MTILRTAKKYAQNLLEISIPHCSTKVSLRGQSCALQHQKGKEKEMRGEMEAENNRPKSKIATYSVRTLEIDPR
ncbi:hypothetical protein VTN00DRAFT_1945 [Thermoascus crustaceus]|uniref:uncharacterized protein n=1 Tax=Thermoascus crustaceus TaxID=5088 RepID=UPI00374357DD